jgi:hypothetical protein
MTFRALSLFFLLLAAGNAQSFQTSIEIIEQFDDLRLVAFIDQQDINDYPEWQPVNGAPPLSIEQAVKAISKMKASNHEDMAAGSISKIELRKIANHDDYWHYLIKMHSNNGERLKYEIYVVLMTGKVIPALIETESFK